MILKNINEHVILSWEDNFTTRLEILWKDGKTHKRKNEKILFFLIVLAEVNNQLNYRWLN